MLLAATIVMSLTTGCTSTSLFTAKKEFPKADAKNPAVEILAIWQPAEGRGSNGVPTRGFAGQFLFFNGQHHSPVEVDGAVRVYLFDDRGTPQQQAKPIHQFDFEAEVWKSHLKKSTLGPSYHVFIPYPRKDMLQARCSLRVRLTPTNGPVIYSESANVVLPGGEAEKPLETANANGNDTSATTFDDDAAQKLIDERLNRIQRGGGGIPSAATQRETANRPIATVSSSRNRTRIQTVSHEEPITEFDDELAADASPDAEQISSVHSTSNRRRPNPLADEE